METQPPPLPPPSPASRRLTVFLKVSGIGLLILLLHIPLFMTHNVLRARQEYQQQATNEIAGIWGRAQRVTGPVLVVPYAYRAAVIRPKVVNGKVVQVEEIEQVQANAFFLPEEFEVGGDVNPEIRRRGIYETVVYTTRLKLNGFFRPDFEAAGIVADRIDWAKAHVLFGVSDLRGVRSVAPLARKDAKSAAFEASDATDAGSLPLMAKLADLAAGAVLDFSFDATLQGSERIDIAPVGKATKVKLVSSWADPSFGGAYLPVNHEVTANGFMAAWEVSHFSRGFPQSWTDRTTATQDVMGKIGGAAFGVGFAQLMDGYRLAERAQKYGVLFFVLVFAVFFLFEVSAGLRIHPLQYAMVGAGLCLFFLGFLALSEFVATGIAYGAAAGACTLLVSLYAWSFLKTGARTLVIGGGLAATYGYLYFVLQSQDYALLAGTAALFGALALVMYCTRRMNWYSLDLGENPA